MSINYLGKNRPIFFDSNKPAAQLVQATNVGSTTRCAWCQYQEPFRTNKDFTACLSSLMRVNSSAWKRLNFSLFKTGKGYVISITEKLLFVLVFNKLIVFYVLCTVGQSYAFFWKDT